MDPSAQPDGHEMFRRMTFPFLNDRFPDALGAVVQCTVLSGERPALEVIHTPEGSWAVADGVNDPNLPGASVATHIRHAIATNSSIGTLAAMPPGHIARRLGPKQPWSIAVLEGWDDE